MPKTTEQVEGGGRKLVVGDQSFDLRLDFFLCPKHGLFVPSRIDAEWNTDQGCPVIAWPGDDETCGANLTPVFLDGLIPVSALVSDEAQEAACKAAFVEPISDERRADMRAAFQAAVDHLGGTDAH
jgi:hypothetical protein